MRLWWAEAVEAYHAARQDGPAGTKPDLPSWWDAFRERNGWTFALSKEKALWRGRFSQLFYGPKRRLAKYDWLLPKTDPWATWEPDQGARATLCSASCPTKDCGAQMCPAVAWHLLQELYNASVTDEALSEFVPPGEARGRPVQMHERRLRIVKYLEEQFKGSRRGDVDWERMPINEVDRNYGIEVRKHFDDKSSSLIICPRWLMHLLDIPETVWGTWKRRAAVGGDPNEMFARDIGLAKNVGAEKGEAAMGFVWDLCREMADMLPGPRAGSGGGASAQGPAPRDFFRLPYKTYKAVWVAYCEHVFMRDTGRVPVGGEELVRPPISLQHFRRCWSDNEEIESTVKLQPDKGTHVTCKHCLEYRVKMADRRMTKELKERATQTYHEHLFIARCQRIEYARHIEAGRQCQKLAAHDRPEATLSMIIDGMGGEATTIPVFKNQPKSAGSVYDLGVVATTVHGHGTHITCVEKEELSKNANLTCTILWHVLNLVMEEYKSAPGGPLNFPRNLCLQADNTTSENKNKYVLAFLASLVVTGKFDKIEYCFLMAGHTHTTIDRFFGWVKDFLYKLTDGARDMSEYMQAFRAKGKETDDPLRSFTLLHSLIDFKSYFEPLVDNQFSHFTGAHQFKFEAYYDAQLVRRCKVHYMRWSPFQLYLPLPDASGPITKEQLEDIKESVCETFDYGPMSEKWDSLREAAIKARYTVSDLPLTEEERGYIYGAEGLPLLNQYPEMDASGKAFKIPPLEGAGRTDKELEARRAADSKFYNMVVNWIWRAQQHLPWIMNGIRLGLTYFDGAQDLSSPAQRWAAWMKQVQGDRAVARDQEALSGTDGVNASELIIGRTFDDTLRVRGTSIASWPVRVGSWPTVADWRGRTAPVTEEEKQMLAALATGEEQWRKDLGEPGVEFIRSSRDETAKQEAKVAELEKKLAEAEARETALKKVISDWKAKHTEVEKQTKALASALKREQGDRKKEQAAVEKERTDAQLRLGEAEAAAADAEAQLEALLTGGGEGTEDTSTAMDVSVGEEAEDEEDEDGGDDGSEEGAAAGAGIRDGLVYYALFEQQEGRAGRGRSVRLRTRNTVKVFGFRVGRLVGDGVAEGSIRVVPWRGGAKGFVKIPVRLHTWEEDDGAAEETVERDQIVARDVAVDGRGILLSESWEAVFGHHLVEYS